MMTVAEVLTDVTEKRRTQTEAEGGVRSTRQRLRHQLVKLARGEAEVRQPSARK